MKNKQCLKAYQVGNQLIKKLLIWDSDVLPLYVVDILILTDYKSSREEERIEGAVVYIQ